MLIVATHRDAFTKREQASEDYEIRRREMEKLQALKEKIAGHQKHLEELDKSVYVSSPVQHDVTKQGIQKNLWH